METTYTKPAWRCLTSIRISHPHLNPTEISEMLNATPQIAQHPGESKVPHGNCRSAGYWCIKHQVDAPNRPSVSLLWAEEFVQSRESQLLRLLKTDCIINIYVGIFSNIVALGFDLPSTPTIWKLEIPIGMEFFSGVEKETLASPPGT